MPRARKSKAREVLQESFDWIAKHGMFPEWRLGSGNYEDAVLSFAAAKWQSLSFLILSPRLINCGRPR